MSKVVSMRDAIAKHVHDGDTVCIDGFTHLICFAAACRSTVAHAPGDEPSPNDAYSVRPCSNATACFSSSLRSVFHAMPMPSTSAENEGKPCRGAGGKYVPP